LVLHARSRDTSAISASATTQRARATASRGPKRASRALEQHLRSREVAELRHRDAAQGERGRVVAQRDPFERAYGIARSERVRRGNDQ
jgi:hypothetical protein